MKLNILAIALLLSTFSVAVFGQDRVETDKEKSKRPSRDHILIQGFYDGWTGVPDNVKVGGLGRGFAAYLMYDFPFNEYKSNFSFAAGVGISTHNIYFDKQIAVLNDTTQAIYWKDIDQSVAGLYGTSKINTTYLEAPFEIRFFGNKLNRNRGFKMAIGMKVGLLIGAHTKVRHALTGPYINEKVNSTHYFEAWRFTPTVRIGWGNFAVFANYSLSPVFESAKGPEIFPFSIGLTISGL